MQNESMTRTKSVVICAVMLVCVAVDLSAQSPLDRPLLTLERGVTGIALYAAATIAVVFSGVRWAMGGGARHLAGVGGGLTVALFAREIMSWLWP